MGLTTLGRHCASIGTSRTVRKAAVAVIGLTVLGFGVVLILLPGPATLVIPLGLAILATEFLWARKLLGPIRNLLRRLKARLAMPGRSSSGSARTPTAEGS
jgi:uncharacterized protein (TIGR02611 family)